METFRPWFMNLRLFSRIKSPREIAY
jgi:hypothetical protein